jgi:hypothetical protein
VLTDNDKAALNSLHEKLYEIVDIIDDKLHAPNLRRRVKLEEEKET